MQCFLPLLLLNDLLNGDECEIINTGSVNTHKSLDVIDIILPTKYVLISMGRFPNDRESDQTCCEITH